ncbi:MAG: ArsA family ATPase [Thermaerobacter sp.]|nr:ArsA family ATPase [Thermaerobacter sp.]
MPTPSAETAERLFFAGKGGVGKTTMAVAAAAFHALHGRSTLLITTDPAAHIGRVLEREVGDEPKPVAGILGLDAARIDPRHETRRYKDMVLSDARKCYVPETVRRIEEELNSPCTEEVAVFRRFLDYLLTDRYETVVFDTAPTGHTLRLLQLPLSYSQQIAAKALGGQATSTDEDAEARRMEEALKLLRDPARTTFAFVVYPEATPIVEAARASSELREIGLQTSLVLVNQVLPEEVCVHALFRRRYEMQQQYLQEVPASFPGAEVRPVHLQERDVIGVDAVLRAADEAFGGMEAAGSVDHRPNGRRQ